MQILLIQVFNKFIIFIDFIILINNNINQSVAFYLKIFPSLYQIPVSLPTIFLSVNSKNIKSMNSLLSSKISSKTSLPIIIFFMSSFLILLQQISSLTYLPDNYTQLPYSQLTSGSNISQIIYSSKQNILLYAYHDSSPQCIYYTKFILSPIGQEMKFCPGNQITKFYLSKDQTLIYVASHFPFYIYVYDFNDGIINSTVKYYYLIQTSDKDFIYQLSNSPNSTMIAVSTVWNQIIYVLALPSSGQSLILHSKYSLNNHFQDIYLKFHSKDNQVLFIGAHNPTDGVGTLSIIDLSIKQMKQVNQTFTFGLGITNQGNFLLQSSYVKNNFKMEVYSYAEQVKQLNYQYWFGFYTPFNYIIFSDDDSFMVTYSANSVSVSHVSYQPYFSISQMHFNTQVSSFSFSSDGNYIFQSVVDSNKLRLFQLCPNMTYLYNQSCLNCSQECLTCRNSASTCTSCQSGYVFQNPSTCLKCSRQIIGCLNCSSRTQCLSCNFDQRFNPAPVNGSCVCSDFYYLNDYYCRLCDNYQNCRTCQSQNKCIKCNTQKFWKQNAVDGSCVCMQGYNQYENQCIKCAILGCSLCKTDQICSNCTDSNRKPNANGTKCVCTDFYFESNNQCLRCDNFSVCKACLNQSQCAICNQAKGFNPQPKIDGSCECLQKSYFDNATHQCKLCSTMIGCVDCQESIAQYCIQCDASQKFQLNDTQHKCRCMNSYYFSHLYQTCNLCQQAIDGCLSCIQQSTQNKVFCKECLTQNLQLINNKCVKKQTQSTPWLMYGGIGAGIIIILIVTVVCCVKKSRNKKRQQVSLLVEEQQEHHHNYKEQDNFHNYRPQIKLSDQEKARRGLRESFVKQQSLLSS